MLQSRPRCWLLLVLVVLVLCMLTLPAMLMMNETTTMEDGDLRRDAAADEHPDARVARRRRRSTEQQNSQPRDRHDKRRSLNLPGRSRLNPAGSLENLDPNPTSPSVPETSTAPGTCLPSRALADVWSDSPMADRRSRTLHRAHRDAPASRRSSTRKSDRTERSERPDKTDLQAALLAVATASSSSTPTPASPGMSPLPRSSSSSRLSAGASSTEDSGRWSLFRRPRRGRDASPSSSLSPSPSRVDSRQRPAGFLKRLVASHSSSSSSVPLAPVIGPGTTSSSSSSASTIPKPNPNTSTSTSTSTTTTTTTTTVPTSKFVTTSPRRSDSSSSSFFPFSLKKRDSGTVPDPMEVKGRRRRSPKPGKGEPQLRGAKSLASPVSALSRRGRAASLDSACLDTSSLSSGFEGPSEPGNVLCAIDEEEQVLRTLDVRPSLQPRQKSLSLALLGCYQGLHMQSQEPSERHHVYADILIHEQGELDAWEDPAKGTDPSGFFGPDFSHDSAEDDVVRGTASLSLSSHGKPSLPKDSRSRPGTPSAGTRSRESKDTKGGLSLLGIVNAASKPLVAYECFSSTDLSTSHEISFSLLDYIPLDWHPKCFIMGAAVHHQHVFLKDALRIPLFMQSYVGYYELTLSGLLRRFPILDYYKIMHAYGLKPDEPFGPHLASLDRGSSSCVMRHVHVAPSLAEAVKGVVLKILLPMQHDRQSGLTYDPARSFETLLTHAFQSYCVQNDVADDNAIRGVYGLVINPRTCFVAFLMPEIPDPVPLLRHPLCLAKAGSKNPILFRLLLQDLVQILCLLEAKGVIHLDLSPDNIVYSESLKQFFLVGFTSAVRPVGRFDVSILPRNYLTPWLSPQARTCIRSAQTDPSNRGYLLYSLCFGLNSLSNCYSLSYLLLYVLCNEHFDFPTLSIVQFLSKPPSKKSPSKSRHSDVRAKFPEHQLKNDNPDFWQFLSELAEVLVINASHNPHIRKSAKEMADYPLVSKNFHFPVGTCMPFVQLHYQLPCLYT